jgi:hypothetical protein
VNSRFGWPAFFKNEPADTKETSGFLFQYGNRDKPETTGNKPAAAGKVELIEPA